MSAGGNKKCTELCNHDFNDPAVAGFYHQPIIAKSVDEYSTKLEGKYKYRYSYPIL